MLHPLPSDQRPSDCADDSVAARRLAMVERLAEIGLALAEALLRQAVEPDAAPVVAADVGLAYSRIARAVRLTVALAGRIERDGCAEDGRAGDGRAGAGAAAGDAFREGPRPSEGAAERARARVQLQVRKDEVRHVAGCAIEAHAREVMAREVMAREVMAREIDPREIDVERLMAALDERLEDREADDDAAWLARPLGELAARVCADLGVRYDPRLWEDDGAAEAAAGEDGPDGIGPDEDGPGEDGPGVIGPRAGGFAAAGGAFVAVRPAVAGARRPP